VPDDKKKIANLLACAGSVQLRSVYTTNLLSEKKQATLDVNQNLSSISPFLSAFCVEKFPSPSTFTKRNNEMATIKGFITSFSSIVQGGNTVHFFGLVSKKSRYLESPDAVYEGIFIQTAKPLSDGQIIHPLALELSTLKDGIEVTVEIKGNEMPSVGTKLDFTRQFVINGVQRVVREENFDRI
jgi:hypothetical protein